MKKFAIVFGLQVLAGLSFASAAQAQTMLLGADFHSAPWQAYAHPTVMLVTLAGCPQGAILGVAQPPMTIPAGVNWEVGRRNGPAAFRCSACSRPAAQEAAELWQVVPKVLRFSRTGRLLTK